MKSIICALSTYLEESKKMLADNQPLVSIGSKLSKLKSIKKQPSLLAVDIFYAMAQAVIMKASPEAICFGGGLIEVVLLANLGIHNNNIVSGIPNCIPSPSNLRYAAKKSRKDTFMRIAGFVCNYPHRMSCNKG